MNKITNSRNTKSFFKSQHPSTSRMESVTTLCTTKFWSAFNLLTSNGLSLIYSINVDFTYTPSNTPPLSKTLNDMLREPRVWNSLANHRLDTLTNDNAPILIAFCLNASNTSLALHEWYWICLGLNQGLDMMGIPSPPWIGYQLYA